MLTRGVGGSLMCGGSIVGSNKVITSGDDNKVMMYDYSTRRFDRKGTVSDHKSTNAQKIKAVTASSMSIYPGN